ncbi:hypothetical protein Tco_0380955, partial [Tanacetum coccineum]
FISQDKYVADILMKFNFATVKTASTLIETNKALLKDEEAIDVDVHLYISMIGSLMYLTDSRPDIMFAVCACAWFQVTPKTSHLHAVKRIFRYLKGKAGSTRQGWWLESHIKPFLPYDAQEIPDEFYRGAYFLLRVAASTLMETNKALLKDKEATDVDVHLYISMIGSLMYLIDSRPDIMFVVCACAWFQVTPKTSHLHAVKRIFRYLKGYPKLGLWYLRDSPFDLETFSDSDYAGASLDRKSTIGGCQFLGRRLISWQCKKQTIVANSTTKADYVATANCCGQTQKPRKAKRATEISQSSGPIPFVSDETVIKEWKDRMERVVTTASSLEVEQDSAQIRFEAASKQSNDAPLSRVNTLGSKDDSMKLKELMELCTKLHKRALDLA